MIKLKVLSPDDRLLASSELGEEVSAVLAGGYAGGERILVETSRAGVLLDIQLEDSMPWERVYVPGASLVFFVPPLERRPNYSPRAFVGNSHLLRAREVTTARRKHFPSCARRSRSALLLRRALCAPARSTRSSPPTALRRSPR